MRCRISSTTLLYLQVSQHDHGDLVQESAGYCPLLLHGCIPFIVASADLVYSEFSNTAVSALPIRVTTVPRTNILNRYNASSQFAPPDTDVTFRRYGTVFSYDAQKLWLAYGIALGASILNVFCGIYAILRTNASFTANFSTVVRLALNAEIDPLEGEAIPGMDPLPRKVAQTILQVQPGDVGGRKPLL